MRITWVTRSFLDYRVPVYKALDELCGNQLSVVYYKDVVPERCQQKLRGVLGDRAIPWDKEVRIGNLPKRDNKAMSNTKFRIPFSRGLVDRVVATYPEVLVSDGFMQWTYAPLYLRATKGIPHVMCYERTEHTERNAGKIRPLYRRFVSRWIDVIDCNGKLTGEYVKRLLGWGEERLTYGHMVADVNGMAEKVADISEEDSIALRKKLGINGLMLLFVGQLIPRKGVVELLQAWKEFKKTSNIDCTLVYVGTGSLETKLHNLITSEQIPNVLMAGRVEYENIATYYKAADCFIIPTLEDNWSLVVPEAMACSLPIATSVYNGCYPELVQSANGWTFDPLNLSNVVNTLQNITQSSSLLKDMGEESRKIVAAHTSEQAAKSIMDAIYIAIKHNK